MAYHPPGEEERSAFHAGKSFRAYRWLGARKTQDGSEWRFCVWAPNAQRVCLTGGFCAWQSEEYPMQKQFDGTWELRLPARLFDANAISRTDAGAQDRLLSYKFAILGADGQWHYKADPYALAAELRPNTASRLCDPNGYIWGDGEWMKRRNSWDALRSPINIYEMHLGSWQRGEEGRFLPYSEIADRLIPYLLDLEYTHVELLPVMEHPLDMSWGYQVTGYFAPTARHGSPMDFMSFVDRLHQAGIGVILDWVPAHFPRDESGLRQFDGTPCYEHADWRRSEMKQWGTLLFDFARGEASSFLLSSADFWLRIYHADGLRCDAVSSMLYLDFCREKGEWLPNESGGNLNADAAAFLKRLNETMYREHPGILMIAEESTAYPGVTHPTNAGGLGFGFKWNMGWMNDMLRYIGEDPVNRKYHHGKLTFSLMYAFSENYILPFSHDEVVHGKKSLLDKQPGDLWRKFAGLRALLGYQMAHPGKKLNFMGSEFGHFIEWNFDGQLDWFLLQYERHPGILACVRDLNRRYKSTPALWQADDGWDGFEWLQADDCNNSIVAFRRMDRDGNTLVCVTNFTPDFHPQYRIGLPAYGFLREILNTDLKKYGGSNQYNAYTLRAQKVSENHFRWSVEICVPPLSTVYFRYTRPRRRKPGAV